MTLLQSQIVPLLVHSPYPHIFYVFSPTMWIPKKTPQIHFQRGLQNVLQTFSHACVLVEPRLYRNCQQTPIVRAKNEAVELGLTRAHNLFILWAGVSYFGSFSALRLNWISSSSRSLSSLFFPLLSEPFNHFPPLTSHIYSPKLMVRLWLLPWLVQWDV